MIRSVSLDLGGTLLTEEPPRFEIYAQEARRLLASAGRSEERAVTAAHMKTLMRRVHARMPEVYEGSYRYSDPWFERFIAEVLGVELGLDGPAVREGTQRLFERFESPATFRLFPGTDLLLTGIRDMGLRLGVLSNWSARLPRVLAAVGLAKAFDFVVCSALDRVEKPDPGAFALAAERGGVDPAELLHAGDRVDLDGACERLGCTFVLVRHAGHEAGATGVDAGAPGHPGGEGPPRGARSPATVASLPELLDRIRSHVA